MKRQHYERMRSYDTKVKTNRKSYDYMQKENRINPIFTDKPHYGIAVPAKEAT